MVKVKIGVDKCSNCGTCVDVCPSKSEERELEKPVINIPSVKVSR